MTLDTQMTLALLQELLMALRAKDADGYKSWLALGIEQLGRDLAAEVESDWMVPLVGGRGEGRALIASTRNKHFAICRSVTPTCLP